MNADDTRETAKFETANDRIAHLRNLAMDEARELLGMTWNEVAEHAGISPQALRKIRSGESLARTSTLRALEQALQLPEEALSGRTLRSSPEEIERRHRQENAMTVIMSDTNAKPRTKMVLRPTGEAIEKYLLVALKGNPNLKAADMRELTELLQAVADTFVDSRR